jgi:hypothetical protein
VNIFRAGTFGDPRHVAVELQRRSTTREAGYFDVAQRCMGRERKSDTSGFFCGIAAGKMRLGMPATQTVATLGVRKDWTIRGR